VRLFPDKKKGAAVRRPSVPAGTLALHWQLKLPADSTLPLPL